MSDGLKWYDEDDLELAKKSSFWNGILLGVLGSWLIVFLIGLYA